MVTIKITELGNKVIGFYIFNSQNQLIKNLRKLKMDKEYYTAKLRKYYMKRGESVFCHDLTV